jgi:hypothetical protein
MRAPESGVERPGLERALADVDVRLGPVWRRLDDAGCRSERMVKGIGSGPSTHTIVYR